MKKRSPVDQTPLGLKILAIVRAHPGLSTVQIAKAVESTPTMARRYLDRLSGEGFVYKEGNINLFTWYPKKVKGDA
ncbi:MAG: winged helix-turn-helix domain-containing protein [Oscillatoriophycideae cyanobacterium NC_groundwater_1537_Pr4_S-0.65um_50_18]|nr:winged helix-turn-helix domain-containing protein [Oscillatoriophycideae cyanobacterium NC_groundwater_1537_Pr4_S-0.65um_50_18]